MLAQMKQEYCCVKEASAVTRIPPTTCTKSDSLQVPA